MFTHLLKWATWSYHDARLPIEQELLVKSMTFLQNQAGMLAFSLSLTLLHASVFAEIRAEE